MIFHRGSESGSRPHPETPARETHPTSVRRSTFPHAVSLRVAWRAWAKLAGSQEDAYFIVHADGTRKSMGGIAIGVKSLLKYAIVIQDNSVVWCFNSAR